MKRQKRQRRIVDPEKLENVGWKKAKPKRLPKGWSLLPPPFDEAENGCGYWHESGLRVLASVLVEKDARRWFHVSCSLASRRPSYEELCTVKAVFVGSHRRAIQVFPPKAEHVNFHPYTLHLWCCLDGDGLPDFRRDGVV